MIFRAIGNWCLALFMLLFAGFALNVVLALAVDLDHLRTIFYWLPPLLMLAFGAGLSQFADD